MADSGKVCDDRDHGGGFATPASCGRGERGLHVPHAGRRRHTRGPHRDETESPGPTGTPRVYPRLSRLRGEQTRRPPGSGQSITGDALDRAPRLRRCHLLSPGSVLALLTSSAKATPAPSSLKTLVVCGGVTATPTPESRRGHPSAGTHRWAPIGVACVKCRTRHVATAQGGLLAALALT